MLGSIEGEPRHSQPEPRESRFMEFIRNRNIHATVVVALAATALGYGGNRLGHDDDLADSVSYAADYQGYERCESLIEAHSTNGKPVTILLDLITAQDYVDCKIGTHEASAYSEVKPYTADQQTVTLDAQKLKPVTEQAKEGSKPSDTHEQVLTMVGAGVGAFASTMAWSSFVGRRRKASKREQWLAF